MMALMASGTMFATPRFDSRTTEGLERSEVSASAFGTSGSMIRSDPDVSGRFDRPNEGAGRVVFLSFQLLWGELSCMQVAKLSLDRLPFALPTHQHTIHKAHSILHFKQSVQ